MTAPQIPPDSPLARIHKTLPPQPAARNAVALEQLFLSGECLAMIAVQAAGFVATYIFLAHTSEKAPPRPPPPVTVEIFR